MKTLIIVTILASGIAHAQSYDTTDLDYATRDLSYSKQEEIRQLFEEQRAAAEQHLQDQKEMDFFMFDDGDDKGR